MEKQLTIAEQRVCMHGLANCFPRKIMLALLAVAQQRQVHVYLVGGTVRDWLLGRNPHDLDLTVAADAEGFCLELIAELGGGTLVSLGTATDEAARVVWHGLDVDISSFRGGAADLYEDLSLRDFTVNSMAVDIAALMAEGSTVELIDPMGGLADLEKGRLHHCPQAFQNDPLRLLRAYRFMATLGFQLDDVTRKQISDNAKTIIQVAAERVRYELELIMQSDSAADVLWQMHESGLLIYILPELYAGEGVNQPDFHHLDVFNHNFQTLREMEQLLSKPEEVYPQVAEEITNYLKADSRVQSNLKWAALLHDIGKPAVQGRSETDSDRVTFHGHDDIGRKLFDVLARRLKWSNEERERTGDLIVMHMHPFHLCNVRRQQNISVRAALKLCRRAGKELPGLFLLAMSDSLASQGELKPENMEDELVELYNEVAAINTQHIRPALSGPPLLSGRDLIEHCDLQPGPIFSVILEELQALQVEGVLHSREEALAWVDRYIREQGKERDVGCQ